MILQGFLLLRVGARKLDVGGHQRQHDEVGHDLVADPNRCSNGQLPDHRDGDDDQGDEAHKGGHERQAAGDEKAGETGFCSGHRRGTGRQGFGNGIDLLFFER